MTQQPKEDRLIRHLYELADRDDRAALAALRDGLRPDRAWAAMRIVMPRVAPRATSIAARQAAEDDALLLAGLFALHPDRGSWSLPAALRWVMNDTQSESIEGRFEAMLGASKADLPDHLRHAVALVRGSGLPGGLDWARLYTDLRRWSGPTTRRRWARDFWGAPPPAAADSAPDTEHTPST